MKASHEVLPDARSDALSEEQLEALDVVANCTMNRERELVGANGYGRELGFDPLPWLRARPRPARWLDLCCGSARALLIAARTLEEAGVRDIELIGVDLVGMFHGRHPGVQLIVSPLRSLPPPAGRCDLISIVHGLHYVGDKLGTLERVTGWLKPDGRLVAQLDLDHVLVHARKHRRRLLDRLRAAGVRWDPRRHRISIEGPPRAPLGLIFVGARRGGPNYTGQPAVRSDYRWSP